MLDTAALSLTSNVPMCYSIIIVHHNYDRSYLQLIDRYVTFFIFGFVLRAFQDFL